MSILTILAAAGPILQAGTTLASGLMGNSAIEDANKKNLELAYIERDDTLKHNKTLADQAQQGINISKQASLWNREQQKIDNARNTDNTNYERLQRAGNRYAEFLSAKSSLKANNLAGFQRG